MTLRKSLLAAVLAVVSAAPAIANNDAAREALARRDYAAVLSIYEVAPARSAVDHYRYAIAAARTQSWEKAQRSLEEAKGLDPTLRFATPERLKALDSEIQANLATSASASVSAGTSSASWSVSAPGAVATTTSASVQTSTLVASTPTVAAPTPAEANPASVMSPQSAQSADSIAQATANEVLKRYEWMAILVLLFMAVVAVVIWMMRASNRRLQNSFQAQVESITASLEKMNAAQAPMLLLAHVEMFRAYARQTYGDHADQSSLQLKLGELSELMSKELVRHAVAEGSLSVASLSQSDQAWIERATSHLKEPLSVGAPAQEIQEALQRAWSVSARNRP